MIAFVTGGSLYEKPELEFVESVRQVETLLHVDLKKMSEKNFELMENLRQSTIKRIYGYWRRIHKRLDCFHVAFSGGKDSVVLLDLVKHALPKASFIVVFGDTHMEFPDTYKIIDEVEKQCTLFGSPSTVLRWCCSVHKVAPQTLKIREILGKPDYVGADFVGVRAQESVRRSGYDVENVGMKQRGQLSHNLPDEQRQSGFFSSQRLSRRGWQIHRVHWRKRHWRKYQLLHTQRRLGKSPQ